MADLQTAIHHADAHVFAADTWRVEDIHIHIHACNRVAVADDRLALDQHVPLVTQ